MHRVKPSHAINAPRPLLAWLGWIALVWIAPVCIGPVTCAQADDALGPVVGGTQATAPQLQPADESISPGAQLPGQGGSAYGTSIRPPDEMIAEPGPGSETGVDLPSNSAHAERPHSRIWNLFPLGMIPYVGPRTPDEMKHRGVWGPIDSGGWRGQPFAISGFAGVTDGGPIMHGHVDERPSAYEGLNFSWDYDHYWGFEKRLGFGELNLTNGNHQPLSTGGSITGEYRFMYYPLGNSRWRPFLTAGLGWTDFYFHDDQNMQHIDTVFTVPFGAGLKYLYTDRIAFRADLIDEFTVGYGAVSTFHYVALTFGLEVRYGKRLLHMPWHRKDGS
ncbi:MAG TPA: hypothetical protein VIK18_14705 [Pirellulales bacterium]